MAIQTDPRLHGVPQSRGRLYQPCVAMHLLKRFGIDGEEFGQRIIDTYLRFCGIPVMALKEFLLPDDHPAVLRQLRAAEQKYLRSTGKLAEAAMAMGACHCPSGPDDNKDSSKKLEKWPAQHQEYFVAKGLEAQPSTGPSDEMKQLWPGLYDLSRRELDVLRAYGIKDFPEDEPGRCINVQVSLGRQRLADASCCVTPSLRLYVTSKCRLLTGHESFALQGVHYGPQNDALLLYDNAFLQNLAGNAFQTLCCQSVLISIMIALTSASYSKVEAPSNNIITEQEEDDDPNKILDSVWDSE